LLLRGINIAEFKFTVERAQGRRRRPNARRADPPANLIFKGDVSRAAGFANSSA
jgi:hypothetical protein